MFDTISSKIVLQNALDFVVIKRPLPSVALATLMTAIFHASVVSYDRYINEYDVYADGKFSVTTLCANAFLLAVPAFLRYLLSPTHLDDYIPYNSKDLLLAASYVSVIYLMVHAVKYIWKRYDLPVLALVDRKLSEKIHTIDIKLNKLVDIEARLMAMQGMGVEGTVNLQKGITVFRAGEVTPPKEELGKELAEAPTPNPGNTPRVHFPRNLSPMQIP